MRCRPAATFGAQPCASCSITLMTQLIVILFAINLDVRRNSTHLLLINTALKQSRGLAGLQGGLASVSERAERLGWGAIHGTQEDSCEGAEALPSLPSALPMHGTVCQHRPQTLQLPSDPPGANQAVTSSPSGGR